MKPVSPTRSTRGLAGLAGLAADGLPCASGRVAPASATSDASENKRTCRISGFYTEVMAIRLRRLQAVAVAAALALTASAARAQQKTLTLGDIYDPQKRVNFSGRPVTGLTWVDGTHYAWPRG